MTFVLSVHGRDSFWLVADRRLSYGKNHPPVDDALKVMALETNDGVGVLAYAGLGATRRRTQPSDWMSATLRGRRGLTFEQSVGIISDAANRELPKFLPSIAGNGHFIMVPAFVKGVGPRLYTIDNFLQPGTRQHLYRYAYVEQTHLPSSPCVRIGLAGSGGGYFHQKPHTWLRTLLNLVKAREKGRISDDAIADHLARLNYEAHLAVQDRSVGPRCVVVWRRRGDARHPMANAGHQFYRGTERDACSLVIPTICNGNDLRAFTEIMIKRAQLWRQGEAPTMFLDTDELNRQLGMLPSGPDEHLR